MRVPKEIGDKIRELQSLESRITELTQELTDWFDENTGTDGIYIERFFIVDKPTGKSQSAEGLDEEYCDQRCICEDYYVGSYYHKVDDSEEWAGYSYST